MYRYLDLYIVYELVSIINLVFWVFLKTFTLIKYSDLPKEKNAQNCTCVFYFKGLEMRFGTISTWKLDVDSVLFQQFEVCFILLGYLYYGLNTCLKSNIIFL